MPKANSSVKIALGHKYTFVAFYILVVSFLLTFWLVSAKQMQTVTIGRKKFLVATADTPAEQARGLGGRNQLAPSGGMLFRFTRSGTYCFWMKDMRFSLDIIWADENKKVVYTKDHISPDSYPQTFCSPTNAKYALEVKGGTIDQLNIHTGESISF